MNNKFYELSNDRQNQIINGALKIFSKYEYKKASTDMIAKSSGVSKALLFHYFENKKGLYIFLYDYSSDYLVKKMSQYHNYKENDFFKILFDAQMSKTKVLSVHPHIMLFLVKAYFEESEEIRPYLNKQFGAIIDDSSERFLKRADTSKFKDGVDAKEVLNIVLWMSNGYMSSRNENDLQDLIKINDEYLHYLNVLKNQFYKEEYLNENN